MEIRQLFYFLHACQCETHNAAAERGNVSASTLSKSLKDLEQELGLALFQRSGMGSAPTDMARWLQSRAAAVLRLVELVETQAARPSPPPLTRLCITSPLRFMDGTLTRAAARAADELASRHPGCFVDLCFADLTAPAGPVQPAQGHGPDMEPQAGRDRVLIDYVVPGNTETTCQRLYTDPWIGLTNSHAGGGVQQAFGPAQMRRRILYLPPLPESQLRLARDWCATHGLPDPVTITTEADLAAQLAGESRAFVLLSPTSFAKGPLAKLGLSEVPLAAPLDSEVGAWIDRGSALAREWTALLGEALRGRIAPHSYLPRLTLRQMRYVDTLRDCLNMSVAARRLHVSQPTLSNQLAKVESLLGRPLFSRHRGGLALADDAGPLVQLISEIVARCADIQAEALHMAASRHGQLVFGIVPLSNHRGPLVEALCRSIEDFRTDYPGVRLKVIEGPAVTLQRWVESGQLSLALVESRVSRFSQIDLMSRDRLGLVTDPRWSLLPPGEVKLAQAAALRLVLANESFGLRQLIDRAAEKSGVRIVPELECNSLALSLAMLRRIPVATIMPAVSVELLTARGNFQFNPITEPEITRSLSVVFNPDRSLTGIEHALIAILRKNLREGWVSAALSDADGEGEAAAARSATR